MEGHKVIGLDDLSSGSLENIEDIIPLPNFDFVKYDIREKFECRFDAIMNFACPASPRHCQNDLVETIEKIS